MVTPSDIPLDPALDCDVCLCCGNKKPHYDFAANTQICSLCTMLPVLDAINTTWQTCKKRHDYTLNTAAGRKGARRAAKMAALEQHGKRCGACWQYLHPSAFAVCNRLADGLQANCRACCKLRNDMMARGNSQTQIRVAFAALRSIAPPKRTA